MTTKWKIVAGFTIMVVLVGVVVLIGYSGINKSSDGFVEYRRLARLNVALSNMEASLNAARSNVYAYTLTQEGEHIQMAKKNIARFMDEANVTEEFSSKQSTLDTVTTLKKEIAELTHMIDNVQQSVTASDKEYRDVVLVNSLNLIKHLDTMGKNASDRNNALALSTQVLVWSDLSKFMSGVSRFAYSHTDEDANIARGYLDQISKAMVLLDNSLVTQLGREDMAKISSYFASVTDAFSSMEQSNRVLANSTKSYDDLMFTIIGRLRALSNAINDQMVEYGTASLASNAGTQRYMMIIGISSLVIGIGIAMFIVLGIVKVLSELSVFASAIAEGDFEHKIKNKEKGEIGKMVASMRAIPQVLSGIIDTANHLANDIRKGKLRDRIIVEKLPGAFSGLGMAVNTVSNSFSELIDNMPLPVMSCDKAYNILFFNAAGQKVVDGNNLGVPCKDQINASACSTEACIGKKAMEQKSMVTSEVTMHPHGKRIEAMVTAIPSYDSNGEIAGFIEIIADLTAIKDQQTTMLKVAGDASVISDRVAAASEELAAQVEEISRGAEMQRARVESTASAMTEMNATVLEVARNASQASEQTETTRAKAEDGARLVNQVVDAISQINAVGAKLQQNMQELGNEAQSIGGVMNVITDIADQTNLLALNAAIEAARAGEAGRGFAVVADEVRKLAEKTMSATQEVGANINAIQQSAKVNIEEVGHAVASVSVATELASASGAALDEIVSLASTNSAVVASIATAAEEQSATSEEINTAIDEINRITNETTEGMVQSSEAVQELSGMAQELKNVMQHLK